MSPPAQKARSPAPVNSTAATRSSRPQALSAGMRICVIATLSEFKVAWASELGLGDHAPPADFMLQQRHAGAFLIQTAHELNH